MIELCQYCRTPIQARLSGNGWVHSETSLSPCLPIRYATPTSEDNADIDAIIYEGRIL